MSVIIGTKLGSYEITALLGKGGMGEVYRARDSKLKRDVAIKILPDEFSRDPDRVSRSQREAEVLAALNHPNIAAIHNLEEANGSRYLVLELVEGETLADRLKRGPVPLDEALPMAKQIAEALEAAHESGIIHRDLKPLNIKITSDGKVKVLDFGLAKAFGNPGPASDLSSSPTVVSGSMPGVVLGTAAYMSPEQARGKSIDARTDIWAFGAVLFEMLTARQAFEGETATDIIAKIVAGQPNWDLLPAQTPSPIRSLLAATLKKEPKQRLQHIGDIRLFLDPAFFPPAAKLTTPSARRGWLILAAFVLVLAAVFIPAAFYFRRVPMDVPEVRFEIPIPQMLDAYEFSVSPDGRLVAYAALNSEGRAALWVRPIGSLTPQQLPARHVSDFRSAFSEFLGGEMAGDGGWRSRTPMAARWPRALLSRSRRKTHGCFRKS